MSIPLQTYKLGDIADVIRGVTFRRNDGHTIPTKNHLPVLRAGNIQDRLILEKDLVWVPQAEISKKQLIKQNDIVMCTSSGSADIVGKCAISETDWDGSFGAFCIGIRPQKVKCIPSYLLHYLHSPIFTNWSKNSSGANIKNIRKSELENFSILLPPLTEQKRIAAILDKADAIRRKRQSAIKLSDDFLRATFLDMFGDQEGNGWEMVSVEDIAINERGAIRTGPFGSQLLHSEFVEKGVSVLGIDNVVENEFRDGKPRFITPRKYEELTRYTVKPGDVLISIMGTCGRCAIVPKGINTAINTKHLCCITLDHDKCLPNFMHAYFLMHPSARRYLERSAKGAIMSGLNMAIIKALPIPMPPVGLQQRFSSIADSIKQQKVKLCKHISEFESMFAALQQRAFRGEL